MLLPTPKQKYECTYYSNPVWLYFCSQKRTMFFPCNFKEFGLELLKSTKDHTILVFISHTIFQVLCDIFGHCYLKILILAFFGTCLLNRLLFWVIFFLMIRINESFSNMMDPVLELTGGEDYQTILCLLHLFYDTFMAWKFLYLFFVLPGRVLRLWKKREPYRFGTTWGWVNRQYINFWYIF